MNGWPEERKLVSEEVRPYLHHREELTVENGIIFKGDRCVIPLAMRADLLRKLHSSHMGIEATLRRARQLIFWPGMNEQLKDMVSRCEVCQAAGKAQPKESLCSHAILNRPWQVTGANLFKLGTADFLILADYWSGFWEVERLQDMVSATVMLHMRRQFARHGIPQ